MQATIMHHGCEISFCDTDVVNCSEYGGNLNDDGGMNRYYSCHSFLIHNYGLTLAVVFAANEGDSLDIAVDAGKLDRFKVSDKDMADYGDTEEERDERLTYLGNASEAFDIESLDIIKLTNPPFSLVALFRAAANESVEAANVTHEKERSRLSRDLSYYQLMVESARENLRRGNPDGAMAALLRVEELIREEVR